VRIGWGLTISSVNLRKFLILDGIVCWWQVSNYTPQLFWSYHIFSIKRRGAFIQISAPQTGIYSNLVFIRGPAFIYWMYFSSIHFLPSVLEVYWIENQTNWEPNVKQCHELLSHLTESGMSFIKKHHWPEQWLNFSQLFISGRKCIGNCSTANVLCKQFRASWWQAGGSRSISSEKGKIWRDSRKL